MRALLRARRRRRARPARDVALADVRLRAPIIPKKFFHTAGNFREHHEESTRVNWSHPVLPWIVFFQNVDAIIGPDDPIVYPEAMTNELDYELELAVIIGKAGKFFSPEEAEDYIAGYIVFNDITARDIQREEMKSGVFCLSKSIDTFCPIGPVDRHRRTRSAIRTTCRWSCASTASRASARTPSRMSVTVPEIISHYSAMGYSPGDIISTGTVAGVAGFSEDAASLYLKPGDVVEAEIERIGVLRNPVISWAEGHPERVRRRASRRASDGAGEPGPAGARPSPRRPRGRCARRPGRRRGRASGASPSPLRRGSRRPGRRRLGRGARRDRAGPGGAPAGRARSARVHPRAMPPSGRGLPEPQRLHARPRRRAPGLRVAARRRLHDRARRREPLRRRRASRRRPTRSSSPSTTASAASAGWPPRPRRATERARGNWGLLDQIAALEWVRENIARFRRRPRPGHARRSVGRRAVRDRPARRARGGAACSARASCSHRRSATWPSRRRSAAAGPRRSARGRRQPAVRPRSAACARRRPDRRPARGAARARRSSAAHAAARSRRSTRPALPRLAARGPGRESRRSTC